MERAVPVDICFLLPWRLPESAAWLFWREGRRQKMTFWNHVSGEIPYPLTNDYLFRVVVQRHDRVLRDILCSMLSLKKEDIQSIRITEQGA